MWMYIDLYGHYNGLYRVCIDVVNNDIFYMYDIYDPMYIVYCTYIIDNLL
jgi:hypothetical protein